MILSQSLWCTEDLNIRCSTLAKPEILFTRPGALCTTYYSSQALSRAARQADAQVGGVPALLYCARAVGGGLHIEEEQRVTSNGAGFAFTSSLSRLVAENCLDCRSKGAQFHEHSREQRASFLTRSSDVKSALSTAMLKREGIVKVSMLML